MNRRFEQISMIEKWRKSITFKIFLITSCLLITLSLFIYFTLYFFLPSFYEDYKINNLERGVQNLVNSVANDTVSEAVTKLNNFSHDYNVSLYLITPQGEVLQNFPLPAFEAFEFIINERFEGQAINIREAKFSSNSHSNYTVINFNEERYILTYVATLQPIDEVASMLFMFIPYIVAIIFCFTMISVTLYSKIITKPLLQINRVAKRMADLDFDETCVVNSDNEIGQLSRSLNQMTDNLKKTMFNLKHANQQLMDDIQRERELEKKRNEFIATISHELKTPITTVKGQIEAMIYNIGPYKDHNKYLRRSYEVMGEMESLVREVLTVSKFEYFEPQMEQVDLTEIIMVCSDGLEYFYDQKDLQLKMTLDRVNAYLDPNLIKKAIGNVLNNAVKYAPNGAQIEVGLTIENQSPVVRIFNSGTSIDESELEKIFDAFYRLEKSRNRDTGGSGLGLYIVHQILKLHHIDYEIKNVDGGVSFTMVFPKNKSYSLGQ